MERRTTSQLSQGDIVYNQGMRILLDGPPRISVSHSDMDTYVWPGKVLNADALCDRESPHYDSYIARHLRGIWWQDRGGRPEDQDRWAVQGNDMAIWDILTHTHYSPYGMPRQVPGTLLDCTPEFPSYHRVEGSELSADYMYSPRFGPVSDTGLPPEMEWRLRLAYLERKTDDLQWRIADVVADPEYTYRVRITSRTMYNGDGPDWHTEEWGIWGDGQWHGIPRNPHPPYEHDSSFCPNCGY